MYIVNIIQLIN